MLRTGLPLRVVPIRFVLTLSLVCNQNFQSLGLRKHPKVSLRTYTQRSARFTRQ
jgi:hypothetical protein